MVTASMAGKSKPYCELGKLLDSLARDHDVRGPYNIASYVEDAPGYEVSGQLVSKYLYGKSRPKPEFVEAFADAFEPYAAGARGACLELLLMASGCPGIGCASHASSIGRAPPQKRVDKAPL